MDFNTTEEILSLTIPNGQSSGKVGLEVRAGQIVRAKIFHTGLANNAGFVNASIEDDNRKELSRPQHIDNYKGGGSAYLDCKPFYHDGGKKLWFKVEATANFTAEFRAQLILIYADGVEIVRNFQQSHDNC